jgi:4-hydroxy-tetrahydrodipicolinate synthase
MKDPFDIGICGSCTALITPFHEDGSIDEESLRRLVYDTVESGINFLCVLGTTAETPTLTANEQMRVRRIAVEAVAGRRPILLGYGSNNTADVIRRMQNDTFEGIDALLMVTPYYNKPSQEGLYRHFRAIAEVSPLPIVLYNVPGRTGVNMTAETTLRIARDCFNVIGVKEASGNPEQIGEIIAKRPVGFRVLSGDDKLTRAVMKMGGEGVISVISNLFPKEMASMVEAMRQDVEQKAADIERRLAPFYDMLFAEGSPSGVKAAMSLQGRCKNVVRLPLVPVSEALTRRMADAIKEMKE